MTHNETNNKTNEANSSSVIDLETRDVNKHYGDFTAVDNVSLQIEKGSFFSILGPSGCGKTTLLRMIAGFDEPDSGDILIQGNQGYELSIDGSNHELC